MSAKGNTEAPLEKLWSQEAQERGVSEPSLVVDVSGFEGPLDLLLHLARTQKVDLARIPVLALETAPVIILLVMLLDLTVQGNAAMRYTQITARDLLAPPAYAGPVLTASPTADPKPENGAEWMENYPSRSVPPDGDAAPTPGDPDAGTTTGEARP